MAPQSALEVARTRLLASLTALQPTLPPWRFHRYPPNEVVSPCIWIDYPTLSRTSPPFITATFPVVIVLDGTDHAQAAAFDYALAQVWDALDETQDAHVVTGTPWARDIGGPTARLYVVSVDVDVSADSLCYTPLYADSATNP